MDFGHAKMSPVPGPPFTFVEPGIRVGTPGYIAPEAALRQEFGPFTDVYSLG